MLDKRDEYSALVIQDWILKRPGERMIAIWGALHLLNNRSERTKAIAQQQRVLNLGISVQSYILAARRSSNTVLRNRIPEVEALRTDIKEMYIAVPDNNLGVDGIIFSEAYSLFWTNQMLSQLGYPLISE
jgi:hypothetical protein